MLFACYWYAIRVLFLCQYMFLCTTNMSFACHFHVLVCNLYVTSIYSYVMVFHRYVLVCHLYVSGVYSCVMECHSYVLACHPYVTRLSSVCHLYALVCHPYVTHTYSNVAVRGFTMSLLLLLQRLCYSTILNLKGVYFIQFVCYIDQKKLETN